MQQGYLWARLQLIASKMVDRRINTNLTILRQHISPSSMFIISTCTYIPDFIIARCKARPLTLLLFVFSIQTFAEPSCTWCRPAVLCISQYLMIFHFWKVVKIFCDMSNLQLVWLSSCSSTSLMFDFTLSVWRFDFYCLWHLEMNRLLLLFDGM